MFILILSTVAVMLAYMLIGFILCRSGLAKVDHAKSLSALLVYVLGPCMVINAFLQIEYSSEELKKLGVYALLSLGLQLLFFALLYLFFSRRYEDARYRIMTAGGVLGNVGFMGMPILARMFPDDPIVLCYSSMHVMTMNLIVFTVGTFLITNDRKYVSVKGAILNPTSIGILIAFPLYIFNVHMPEALGDGVALLAKMVTPMCMIILGMRLSQAHLKTIFSRPIVYATSAIKLVAFPVFAFLCLHWIGAVDDVMKGTMVVLSAMPSAAIIESLAEMHECEQDFAANVVLLSTILSVIAIPVIVVLLL